VIREIGAFAVSIVEQGIILADRRSQRKCCGWAALSARIFVRISKDVDRAPPNADPLFEISA
jgi:hypothetical protein